MAADSTVIAVDLGPEGFEKFIAAGERMLAGATPPELCGPAATGEGTRSVVASIEMAIAGMDLARAWADDGGKLRQRAVDLARAFEQRAERLEHLARLPRGQT